MEERKYYVEHIADTFVQEFIGYSGGEPYLKNPKKFYEYFCELLGAINKRRPDTMYITLEKVGAGRGTKYLLTDLAISKKTKELKFNQLIDYYILYQSYIYMF